jgi:peptidoglycan hydrolase-like protein with peptidoglycan-binding domain
VEVKVKSPSSTTVVIPGWPTLKQGNSGDEVAALQYLLRSHGYALTADGIFGPGTRSTVLNFQSSKSLSADGIVGPTTWNTLISGKTVKKGDSSDAVRAAQYLLVNKFGYSLTIDGVFGSSTKQAVIDFQTTYGLPADGIVGPDTWKALIAL